MREIKFRAKDHEGNWVYGDLHLNHKMPHVHPFENNRTFINTKTIGQFTGLKDKNGKEIYEGDIVLTPFVDPIFGDMVGEDLCVKRQVKFNDGSFVVNDGYGFIYVECFTRNNHIEICGNIHDNQELLTK